MKRKKLLTTVVAAALIAAQMAMPVMAADGGTLDVDVSTKTGVLRVEVPTTMAIAVDQFEIAQAGAQISSSDFTMTNKSEVDVKVAVESTVTLGSTVSLVSSVDAAEKSTKDEAWLAVAAKTGASSYDDPDTADDTEDYYDLTEANSNVTTFGSNKKANQTFYLEKATGAVSYKLAVPDSNNKVSESFAQHYELSELTTVTDNDELQAAVNENDVYVVVTANVGNDTESVTKIGKGATVAGGTYASTNTYYTAADAAASSLASGKVYVYAGMATAGADGAAAFRYVGKLSNAKETWTADDISKISIAYTITGVTATKYGEVEADCTYGLYTPSIDYENATSISLTKGASAVYANYSDLGFAAADVTSCQVKVGDADYATITPVASTTALKFNVGSTWSAASSVKIYVITNDKVYVYNYK